MGVVAVLAVSLYGVVLLRGFGPHPADVPMAFIAVPGFASIAAWAGAEEVRIRQIRRGSALVQAWPYSSARPCQ